MLKDAEWKNIGKIWQLVDFEQSSPPSWSEYLKDQEEYWGEDRISGARSKNWQWKGSREKWLKHMRSQYEDYVDYCTKWHGKFSKGDVIPVLFTEKNSVIKLCIIENNQTTWANTIELWLQREIKLIPPSSKFVTEVFTFSTTVKENGGPCSSWSKGLYNTHIGKSKVVIGDAVFSIKSA